MNKERDVRADRYPRAFDRLFRRLLAKEDQLIAKDQPAKEGHKTYRRNT